ncbi:GNAT family N-acetyltransferase [Anaerosporobacter faecicola]|uniref:GNAT family N-acetyltransferase n=1 Tax=Anaerosporobacter faecicola TaxID=2718714 RepID=UPI00143A4103|nr:GNAT family N-acetyltransferase [Anaerosporobacter faecicola]
MKTLETEHLILRNFKDEDAKDCFAFLSDKDTCYLDGGYEPFDSMDEEYDLLMKKFKEQEERLMIVLKNQNIVIGTIHLMKDTRRMVKTTEIGYVISPNYRRQGYATEAIREVIRYEFEEDNVKMLVAGVIEDNAASLGLLKKLGFIREGEIHNGFYYPPVGVVSLESFYLER